MADPGRLNSLRQMSKNDLSRRRLFADGSRKPKVVKESEASEDDAGA